MTDNSYLSVCLLSVMFVYPLIMFCERKPQRSSTQNAADKTSGKESSTAAIIRIAILLTFTRTPPVSVLL